MWLDIAPLRKRWECVPGYVTWSDSKNPKHTRFGIKLLSSRDVASSAVHNRAGGVYSSGMLVPENTGLIYLNMDKKDTQENFLLHEALRKSWTSEKSFAYKMAKETRKKAANPKKYGKPAYSGNFEMLDTYNVFPHTLFIKEKGESKILSILSPFMGFLSMHSFPSDSVTSFRDMMRILEISFQSECWTGSPKYTLSFPERIVFPAKALDAEASGTAIPVADMDLRFRSMWGIHHFVTHYFPKEKTFRVLTARSSTGDAQGRPRDCFPSVWNGEDILYMLFQDRFTREAFAMAAREGRHEKELLDAVGFSDVPDGSSAFLDSPFFKFLRFCEENGTGRGMHVLDRFPVNRACGYRESIPLFPLLAQTYMNENAYPEGKGKNTASGIFVAMSDYTDLGLSWKRKNIDEYDSMRNAFKNINDKKKYRPGNFMSQNDMKAYIHSFCMGRDEMMFSEHDPLFEDVGMDERKKYEIINILDESRKDETSLDTFLASQDGNETREHYDLFFPHQVSSIQFPASPPVIDITGNTILPRDVEESTATVLMNGAPGLFRHIYYNQPSDRRIMYSLVTDIGNNIMDGLEHVMHWLGKVNYYLPEICPLPEPIRRKDVDPHDALSFLIGGWAFNRLVYFIIKSPVVSAGRFVWAAPSAMIPDFEKDNIHERFSEFLLKGLLSPTAGYTMKDSCKWFDLLRNTVIESVDASEKNQEIRFRHMKLNWLKKSLSGSTWPERKKLLEQYFEETANKIGMRMEMKEREILMQSEDAPLDISGMEDIF